MTAVIAPSHYPIKAVPRVSFIVRKLSLISRAVIRWRRWRTCTDRAPLGLVSPPPVFSGSESAAHRASKTRELNPELTGPGPMRPRPYRAEGIAFRSFFQTARHQHAGQGDGAQGPGAVDKLERGLIVERAKAGRAIPGPRASASGAQRRSWTRRELLRSAPRVPAGSGSPQTWGWRRNALQRRSI